MKTQIGKIQIQRTKSSLSQGLWGAVILAAALLPANSVAGKKKRSEEAEIQRLESSLEHINWQVAQIEAARERVNQELPGIQDVVARIPDLTARAASLGQDVRTAEGAVRAAVNLRTNAIVELGSFFCDLSANETFVRMEGVITAIRERIEREHALQRKTLAHGIDLRETPLIECEEGELIFTRERVCFPNEWEKSPLLERSFEVDQYGSVRTTSTFRFDRSRNGPEFSGILSDSGSLQNFHINGVRLREISDISDLRNPDKLRSVMMKLLKSFDSALEVGFNLPADTWVCQALSDDSRSGVVWSSSRVAESETLNKVVTQLAAGTSGNGDPTPAAPSSGVAAE